MENKEDGELQPMVLDLGIARRGELDESWLRMFGGAVDFLLKRMFGRGGAVPVKVKGTEKEINSFMNTLKGEKKYVDSAVKYGLDDPRTYKNRYKLDGAIKKFERDTKLKWPVR